MNARTAGLEALAGGDPQAWMDRLPHCPRCAAAMVLVAFGAEYDTGTAETGTRASFYCATCALGVALARHLGPVIGVRQ